MSAFSVAITAWSLTTLVLSANQPNILFLMCDSMDGRNMDPTAGQYPLMNMPNLRALIEKGSVMTKHYASSPQCVPGRTTLFSGRRIDESGGYNNGMGWGMTSDGAVTDPTCKSDYNEATCKRFGNMQRFNLTLFDAMKAIGYDVYLYGKVDVGAGVIEKGNAHYDNQTNATADGFHGGPNPGSGITIETRSANIQRPTKGEPEADENDNNVKHVDWVIAANCIDRLNEIKKSKSTKPWFMYCSINIPHPPYQTNKTWLASVNSKDIPIPAWIAESEFHPADKYMSISKHVWGNFSDEQIKSVRETYYGMNVETDYILGTVLNASYKNGWDASNTIIVFTSDHGDMNMEHRQWLKNSMYEGSSRIPLFFAGPGIKEKNVIRNATATIDVLPTLIEIGGGKPDPSISGYSLTDMLLKNKNLEDTKHPDYVTSQYHSNMGNTGSFMVRKDNWKYIQFGHYLKAFKDYKPQLFDLEKDINEINDVSTSNPDVVEELEAILSNEFNYEYVDCIAKHNDFLLFEEFQWNKYNESELKSRMKQAYDGFDNNDWQILVEWRNELKNTTNTTCEQHAAKWLRPIRDQERIQLYSMSSPSTSTPTTAQPTTSSPSTSNPTAKQATNNVTITIDVDTTNLGSEEKIEAIITKSLNISSDDIISTKIEDGSIIILISIPCNIPLSDETIKTNVEEGLVKEYGDDLDISVTVSKKDDINKTNTTKHDDTPFIFGIVGAVCFCLILSFVVVKIYKVKKHKAVNMVTKQTEMINQPGSISHDNNYIIYTTSKSK